MKRIREALDKAKASFAEEANPLDDGATLSRIDALPGSEGWALREVRIDTKGLLEERIVSRQTDEPAQAAFNVLRTRVRKQLADNKWRTLAVTSPTPACGKTVVSLNLSMSLARAPRCRTVLIDLDLKNPSVAKTLKLPVHGSIHDFLAGRIEARETIVKVDDNLFLALNDQPIQDSSEILQGERVAELIEFATSVLQPEVILVDLPPMSAGDDVLAILPTIDAALLVVAAGQSTTSEVDECEAQLDHLEKLLGVVLNKAAPTSMNHYY